MLFSLKYSVSNSAHSLHLLLMSLFDNSSFFSEGVEWNQVGFFSNSVICQLIDTSSRGVFSLLDEFSLGPRSNGAISSHSTCQDQDFLDEMNVVLESHPHYEPSSQASNNEPGELVNNPVPSHSFR